MKSVTGKSNLSRKLENMIWSCSSPSPVLHFLKCLWKVSFQIAQFSVIILLLLFLFFYSSCSIFHTSSVQFQFFFLQGFMNFLTKTKMAILISKKWFVVFQHFVEDLLQNSWKVSWVMLVTIL